MGINYLADSQVLSAVTSTLPLGGGELTNEEKSKEAYFFLCFMY